MNLVPIIRDLLFNGESVTLPGLGTLQVHYHPAEIKRGLDYLIPPSGEMVFDFSQSQNNGFLEGYIIRLSGCSPEEARIHIEALTEPVWIKLRQGKPAAVAGLGTFTHDQHGRVFFESDAALNLCPDAYGLTPCRMSPISNDRKKGRKK
ncbi:MAG: hypothetical protein V2A67_09995 [Bacteroidota bacterium]